MGFATFTQSLTLFLAPFKSPVTKAMAEIKGSAANLMDGLAK